MNYLTQDAEFCGKVPLAQSNLIQPHGVLLVVNKEGLTVAQASENTEAVFGAGAKDVVKKAIADFITAEQHQTLQSRSARTGAERLPMKLTVKGRDFLCMVHTKQDYLLLEIELKEEEPPLSFVDMYQELKYVMAEVADAATTAEACNKAVQELKRITGFDKIMVYQFDEDWHGTVIAEAAEEGMDRYLGLRFPASDVPKQARDLYFKNPYRLIPNAAYAPVKLHPLLNPSTHAFTDLSDTNLRSVAAVHIEYLKNMGVAASMSTRIIQDDKLWGLIACHHRTPKYLSYETGFVFELVSGVVSAKVASVQKADSSAYREGLLATYQRLLEAVYRQGTIDGALRQHGKDLLDLLKADGAAWVAARQITLVGVTPSQEEVENLTFWLKSQGITKPLFQSNLSESYAEAERFTATGSGLMALPIQPDRGSYLLAFRSEAVQKIDWGGNPNEAITFTSANRTAYHPRASFKIWQETVRATSLPWKAEETEVAEQFRNFLVEYTLNRSDI